MLPLIAQGLAGWGVVHWALAIIVTIGVIAIVIVFIKQTGVAIPPFIISVLWIVLAVIICCSAILFIAKMFGAL